MKKLLLILIFAMSLPIWAQSQLTGTIRDNQSTPIGWATLILQATVNPKKEYFITSEEDGSFIFKDIKNKGKYKLMGSFIGYKDLEQLIDITDSNSSIILIMTPDENILDEVMITSHRKALKVTPGKATLNIEQSNLAKTQSAYDVLKTLPGVTVSQNGELKIKGKSGVTVLMDGQPTQLSAEQLKTILKGTPGSTLQSIEIMNVPPANIDASGTGGVINIISKKKLVQGFYGTVNSTVGVSKKVSTDHSLNLGYSNENWNYNFLYSFSYAPDRLRENYEKRDLSSINKEWLNQSQFSFLNSRSHLIKLDIARTFDKGDVLRLKTAFDYNDTPSTVNTNVLSGANNIKAGQSVQKNDSKNQLTNLTADLSYKMKITEKESWTTSIGTIYIKSDINDMIYGNNGSILKPNDLLTKQQNKYPSDRKEFYFKSDYQKPLWDKENTTAKLEFGVKSNYSILETNERLRNLLIAGKEVNTLHKSKFEYKTGVHAFYGSFDMTLDKWAITAGLRGEYTHINGDTLNHKKLVKQNYFSLFPTVQLTYTANENYSVMASYSRRIERPEYDKLNPAVRYLNSTTTSMGNPNLQPEYSNNIEVSQQFLGFIDLTLGYSRITDPMLYSYFNKGIDQSYFTTINGKNRSEWQASLSMPIPGINWWENYHGIYFFNTRFDNNLVNENKNTIGVFTYNNFKLPHNFSLELTAWYQNGGIESNFRYRSLGEVNLGVSKKFLDDKFTATLAVSDLFKTGGIRTTVLENPTQLTNFTVKNDMRVFKFGISYNFGGKNKKNDTSQEETTINKGHAPIKVIK
ncbi:TonB-dependent receptor [Myroides marinus]|uniref:TonB-dependent receptor domain-containing protein n=2 Tax=Myroides marinus TaxID=703342 RepID=UPI00257918D8|nr:TonB-dependent receptor [Myroides marinus]MDM1349580.1 TonB-dependent receptor [Myroides marinus]MDM1356790.1 TonB-dependent receptor [Myroides marinus]MDM1364363.1 TonB-dependent receptor [Myroides marinus]MDM1371409.1 TonB-dependent receptor [Myroides marinus]MDM1388971.1 TonB-dependent receptor [Myroides marinus]